MARHFILALSAVLIWAFAGPANASTGKRVALVIGNSEYAHAVSLPNPANDAELMASTLRGAGFQVVEGRNLGKTDMLATIDRFTETAYDADVALIYYAGHGLQVDGRNYLIPVDSELTSPAHLKTRAIDLDDMLGSLPPDPAVGIIVLDACRDNPLARTLAASLPKSRSVSMGQGLAPVETNTASQGTGGILIAYATDPGSVALDGKELNSPYTAALARHIVTPGVEIQSALTRVRGDVTEATLGRQRPWHNASLGREIYLGGKPQVKIQPAAQPVAGAAVNQWEVEQALWEEVSKRNTIPHFQAYLAQFPSGKFATIARLNIEQLRKSGTQVAALDTMENTAPQPGSQIRTAVSVPPEVKSENGTRMSQSALGLDRSARADLQLRLTALGHALGGIDGALGRKSRNAISDWQRENGIVSTGYLTQRQYSFLVIQSDPLMPAIRAEHAAKKAAVQKRHKSSGKRTVSRSKRKGKNFMNKAGAFAAGVAVGVVGCKLANC